MNKLSFSLIGAVITALLSTLCCLPALLFLFFGISSGILGFFRTLEYTRIPLLILTILFFILAIYNFRKKISCSYNKKDRIFQYIFFTIFCLSILFLLFYPELIALFME